MKRSTTAICLLAALLLSAPGCKRLSRGGMVGGAASGSSQKSQLESGSGDKADGVGSGSSSRNVTRRSPIRQGVLEAECFRVNFSNARAG